MLTVFPFTFPGLFSQKFLTKREKKLETRKESNERAQEKQRNQPRIIPNAHHTSSITESIPYSSHNHYISLLYVHFLVLFLYWWQHKGHRMVFFSALSPGCFTLGMLGIYLHKKKYTSKGKTQLFKNPNCLGVLSCFF